MAVAKDQIRQIITENNITSVLMFTPSLKTASKISCRNYWKPRWTQLWVMKKIVRVILKATIKGTVILAKHSKASTGSFKSMFLVTAMVSLNQS